MASSSPWLALAGYIYPPRAAAMAPHHSKTHEHNTFLISQRLASNMSATCGNCDCSDRSQCTKKGDSYGVVMPDTGSQLAAARPEVEEMTGAEHDGCKCGTSCSCTNCTCGK